MLFYINPQLYGYSAIAKVLLQNARMKCEFESPLNCISKDGNAVLARFDFDSINPYEHLMVSVTSIAHLRRVRVFAFNALRQT